MKVVGLLSGGKDSCFNLCHCVLQGHELVALATLVPPRGQDEIDSYMYQTVGHDAVAAVAAAIALPLYRAEIEGAPLNQALVYGARDPFADACDARDETEDLYRLLRSVKAHHPDADAVSVGAVLSSYQRVRVEHVALRADINMQPLAFLWQRNQTSLLDDMIAAGLDAVLVKAAGIGLDERDLGKSLRTLRPKLLRLHALYGAHVCGEGGEYESLVLDAPIFRRRVEISAAAYAESVAEVLAVPPLLDPSSAALLHAIQEEGEQGAGGQTEWGGERGGELPQDGGLLRDGEQPQGVGQQPQGGVKPRDGKLPRDDKLHDGKQPQDGEQSQHGGQPQDGEPPQDGSLQPGGKPPQNVPLPTPSGARLVTVAGIRVPHAPADFADEVHLAMDALRDALSADGLRMQDVCHVNVYLTDQALFGTLNAVYQKYFGAAPPSRACVAVPAGTAGGRLQLDAVATCDDGSGADRRALHVQSQSYWAPASIGPYAQAVQADGRVFIAGQIGMQPATLAVVDSGVTQAVLALQHVRRIVLAVREGSHGADGGWVEGGIAWIAIQTDTAATVRAVEHAWTHAANGAETSDDDTPAPLFRHAHEQGIPDEQWRGTGATTFPPLLLVYVAGDALPKHAAVEWQLTAHTGRHTLRAGEDGDEDAYAQRETTHGGVACTYRLCMAARLGTGIGAALLRTTDASDACDAAADQVLASLRGALHIKLVHAAGRPNQGVDGLVRALCGEGLASPTTHIPALAWSLVGAGGAEGGAACVWMS
ncbi:diphthine--ammonia ligase [Malassezia sp. CBS 17886]|nr:diphthine--ammonia ligase [Malassezia sp. CBS 17886]